jgi:hypothetical protein
MARAHARRFMLPGAGKGSTSLGYTTQPIRDLPIVADEPHVIERIASATDTRDEPESPSPAWVDAESELAAERNRVRLLKQAEMAQQARKHITTENRMRDAQRRAKLKHVDITGELFVMRKMLTRGNEQSAVTRLEQLEARLDGVTDLKAA